MVFIWRSVYVSDAASGTIDGTDVSWEIENGCLIIRGTGDLPGYNYPKDVPWYEYANDIETVKVENGITAIGTKCFSNLPRLTYVELAESVNRMGSYPFCRCPNLSRIDYKNALWSPAIDHETYPLSLCDDIRQEIGECEILMSGNYLFYECPKVVFVWTNFARGVLLNDAPYNIYLKEEQPEQKKNTTGSCVYDGKQHEITTAFLQQAKREGAMIYYSTKPLSLDNFWMGQELPILSNTSGTSKAYYFLVYPDDAHYVIGEVEFDVKPIVAYDENSLSWTDDGKKHKIEVKTKGGVAYYAIGKELTLDNYATVGSQEAPEIQDSGNYDVYYLVIPYQNETEASSISGCMHISVERMKEETTEAETQQPDSTTEDNIIKKEKVKLKFNKKAYYSLDQKRKRLQFLCDKNVKLYFKSKNKKVADISSNGILILKKPGTVKIRVSVKTSETIFGENFECTLVVHPKRVKSGYYQLAYQKYTKFAWKKTSGITGYQIQFSKRKDFKKNTKTFYINNSKQNVCYIMHNLTESKMYVRIRTYKTVAKKKIYSKWTNLKKR